MLLPYFSLLTSNGVCLDTQTAAVLRDYRPTIFGVSVALVTMPWCQHCQQWAECWRWLFECISLREFNLLAMLAIDYLVLGLTYVFHNVKSYNTYKHLGAI